MKPRIHTVPAWAALCWSPTADTCAGSTAPHRRAVRCACCNPRETLTPTRRKYASASPVSTACSEVRSSYWSHGRPRAAALPRSFASPRVFPSSQSVEGVPRTSVPLSSSTTGGSMASLLRRNHIIAACPRLFAEEMCRVASTVCGGVASSTKEFHMRALKLLSELQLPPCSAATSPSFVLTAEAAVETSFWRGHMPPFSRFLCSALNASFVTESSPPRSSPSFTEDNWDETLLGYVCHLASWPDAEAAETVTQLMESLARRCTQRRGFSPELSHSRVESVVRRVVAASSPALLSAVVQACQARALLAHGVTGDIREEFMSATGAVYTSRVEEDLHGGSQWKPFMGDRAIKECLHKIVQVLTASSTERRKGRVSDTSDITLAARLQLQRCCLCQIPRHTDDRTRHECAMLIMTALKHAPFTVLLAVYQYLREEGLASAVVAQRFLAHCGVCVTHVTQRGVSLATYLSPVANKAAAEALLHAHTTVLSTSHDVKQREAARSYAVATLNALGFPHIVRSLYNPPKSTITATAVSELRETPHSVVSQVLLRNVSGAVVALEALGASRPEGWLSLPPAATEAMAAVSRLVGQEGSVADVDGLYAALVGFHNAGLFISYYVECVLGGICDRMREVGRQKYRWGDADKATGASPHEVLERVIPLVRATLRYVGDELNADMILELIETALQLSGYAMPLTAALVTALRASMEQSLSLQELLCRMDASTHNLSFLYYYTLCYARDFGSPSTFEHLAALWRINADAIWNRSAHLSPSCRLWKCATCGRLNSDRYNYCVCSALRYSHVLCGGCGYAQDERLRQCRSCGQALLTKVSLGGAVARKAWQCRDCGARNPARQTLLCFRCGRPTGPCIHRHPAAATTASEGATVSTRLKCGSCFACDGDNAKGCGAASVGQQGEAVYTDAVGVCHDCGRFKMDHARQKSIAWVCIGCRQRRSSLERICPSCPQVECLPQAEVRGPVNVPRMCRHCGREEANPFKVVCGGCGSTADPFVSLNDSSEVTAMPVQTVAAVGQIDPDYEQGGPNQRQHPVLHWCLHCHHVQACDDTVALHQQRCCGCGSSCEERSLCLLPPRVCGSCGASLPASYAGSAVCPYCAAYISLVPQPQRCNDPDSQQYWTTVTLHHTCEVLDGCCTRESLLTETSTQSTSTLPLSAVAESSASGSGAPPGAAAAAADAGSHVYLQRRPAIEKTLTCLRREWCSLDGAAWLSMRMDVATLLGRTVNRLCSRVPTSLTARRLSALLKSILAHVDDVSRAAVTGYRDASDRSAQGYFTAVELCHECLGTHPPDLCPFLEDGGLWTCGECGHLNNNSDVCRYVCGSCLTLRPVTQDLLISACWECHMCDRANVQFERYCIHCGVERAAWSEAVLTCWESADDVTLSGDVGGDGGPNVPEAHELSDREDTTHHLNQQTAQKWCGNPEECSRAPLAVESNMQEPSRRFPDALPGDASSASLRDSLADSSTGPTEPVRCSEIPFNPAKCSLCGLVYIEARCPLCLNHIPDVADARGTVCNVQDHCAFIQPSGTTRPQDRVFVSEALVQANALSMGVHVHYTAELGQRGIMEAKFLRR
ncbi:hypothetical protein JKF63_01366 [Porcisia hertigi]|uniref:RanBP2-type domain-containing protein n=1 Tax=Porcisia hertigi TaxID=2761500 RepID=A0A836KZD1_9TRYP|nr:hypothetical protein JKF63_01366 [Porcisia hertigi]